MQRKTHTGFAAGKIKGPVFQRIPASLQARLQMVVAFRMSPEQLFGYDRDGNH